MIGQTIYVFDINRRVYPKRPPGAAYLGEGPIYREHWRAEKVVGETRVSWVLEFGRKVPKDQAKARKQGVVFTAQEVDDDCWLKSHRYRIVNDISRIDDPALLRKIADLIGYKAEVSK
jgi:hypothetical protein